MHTFTSVKMDRKTIRYGHHTKGLSVLVLKSCKFLHTQKKKKSHASFDILKNFNILKKKRVMQVFTYSKKKKSHLSFIKSWFN